jgi:hypothetical protein
MSSVGRAASAPPSALRSPCQTVPAVFPHTAYRVPFASDWFRRVHRVQTALSGPFHSWYGASPRSSVKKLPSPWVQLDSRPNHVAAGGPKSLRFIRHVRAVAVLKRLRPASGDLVDLSDHRHRRLVSRAHFQQRPHLDSQLRPIFCPELHARIPAFALQALPPCDGKNQELEGFLRVCTSRVFSALSFKFRASSHRYRRVGSPAPRPVLHRMKKSSA